MDTHPKTEERGPWLSPRTALYWYFEAEPVAWLELFSESSLGWSTVAEVAAAIEAARKVAGAAPFAAIPI